MRNFLALLFFLLLSQANYALAQARAGRVTVSADTICYGTVITLTTTNCAGSLHWQAAQPNSGFTNLINIQPDSSIQLIPYVTLYFRVYADSSASSDTSNIVEVYVYPYNGAQIYTSGNGPAIYFEADPFNNSNSSTYFWSFGDGKEGKGDTLTHVYDTCGVYFIALSVKDTLTGCRFYIDTSIIITQCYNGVQPVYAENYINVTPNPGNGVFKISTNNMAEGYKCELFSLTGQKLTGWYFNKGSSGIFDITRYGSGIYFLQITGNRQTFTKKIVVE